MKELGRENGRLKKAVAELAWTMSEGKVIKTDKRDRKRPRLSPPDASPAAIFDW